MRRLECPYLGSTVELTDERAQHIASNHPELLPGHFDRIEAALAAPTQVRRSARFVNARLFARWYDDSRMGKHVVVVVVSDAGPPVRHWVVTAYVARKLAEGVVEWPTS
jgi:hypothetical protein